MSEPRAGRALPRPVYLLAPTGSAKWVETLFPGREVLLVRRADDLRELMPGVLLLDTRELSAADLIAALTLAAESTSGPSWLPALVDDHGGEIRLRPLSLGWPTDPAELARWADGDPAAAVLELRHLLARVALARHDLNNPLTSAMAETQLALMDAPGAEVRAGLGVINEQLRRMRDLIASFKTFRPPG